MPDDAELRTCRSRDSFGNPKRAATWEVGTRIGSTLRRAMKPDTENKAERNESATDNETEKDVSDAKGDDIPNKTAHSSPRPHMRRAHWQSFWTGKRNGSERKLILRWIPPIAVNIGDIELPTVIRPVES